MALWVGVALYLVGIFYLSSRPSPLSRLGWNRGDKLLHALEFGGLGLLLARALLATGMTVRRAFGVALLLASLYGASDEIHQRRVATRVASARDWAADSIGAALGAAAAVSLLRQRGVRAGIAA